MGYATGPRPAMSTSRLCPECGAERQVIGVEVSQQYDYKPAEVFVVEYQRVEYACSCCEGQVVVAAKPPQMHRPPLARRCGWPDGKDLLNESGFLGGHGV